MRVLIGRLVVVSTLLLSWDGCIVSMRAEGREALAPRGETLAEVACGGLVTKKIMTEGSFRSVTIGDSKDEVVGRLREMGVTRIRPGLGEQIAVTGNERLKTLESAEGIVIGAGDVKIIFEGSKVQRVHVARIHPEWRAMLEGVKTKEEAFGAVAKILEERSDVEVRALAPDTYDVDVQGLRPVDRALLEKYNFWECAHDDKKGYVHMGFEFAEGTLRRMIIWEAPTGG